MINNNANYKESNKNTNKENPRLDSLSNGKNNKSFESTKTNGHVLTTPLLIIE